MREISRLNKFNESTITDAVSEDLDSFFDSETFRYRFRYGTFPKFIQLKYSFFAGSRYLSTSKT